MSNETQVQSEVHASGDKAFMEAYGEFFTAYSNFKFSFNGALRLIEAEGPGFVTKLGLDGPEIVAVLESSFSKLDKARTGLTNTI